MAITRVIQNLNNNIRSSTIRQSISEVENALTDKNKKLFFIWLVNNQFESQNVIPTLSYLLHVGGSLTEKMQKAHTKKYMERLAEQATKCYQWLDDGIFKISPEVLGDYEKNMLKAKFYLKKIDYLKSALNIQKHLAILTEDELQEHLTTVENFKYEVINNYKSSEFNELLIIPPVSEIESIISQAESQRNTWQMEIDSEEEFIPGGGNFSKGRIVDDSDIAAAQEPMDYSYNCEEANLGDESTEAEEILNHQLFTSNPHVFWQERPQPSTYLLEMTKTKKACFLRAFEKSIDKKPSFANKLTAMTADFFLYERDDTLKSREFIKNHSKSFGTFLNNLKCNSINPIQEVELCLNDLQEKLALTDYSESFDHVIDNLATYLIDKIKKNKLIGENTEKFCNQFVTHYKEFNAPIEHHHSLSF